MVRKYFMDFWLSPKITENPEMYPNNLTYYLKPIQLVHLGKVRDTEKDFLPLSSNALNIHPEGCPIINITCPPK